MICAHVLRLPSRKPEALSEQIYRAYPEDPQQVMIIDFRLQCRCYLYAWIPRCRVLGLYRVGQPGPRVYYVAGVGGRTWEEYRDTVSRRKERISNKQDIKRSEV